MNELNAKQERFIELAIEYDGRRNADAYREVYGCSTDASAKSNAFRLMKNAIIAKRIEEGVEKRRKKREALRDKEELKQIKAAEGKEIRKRIATREEIFAKLTEIMFNTQPYKIDGKLIIPNPAHSIAAAGKLFDMLYSTPQGEIHELKKMEIMLKIQQLQAELQDRENKQTIEIGASSDDLRQEILRLNMQNKEP